MYERGDSMQTNSISLKVDELTLQKMTVFYEPFLVTSPNPYVLFSAQVDRCLVTVYRTQRITFQGTGAIEEASLWGTIGNTWLFHDTHGGSDEVGTGDFFGPIVVAACYVTADQIALLNSWGVKDSKQLRDEQIMILAPKLMDTLPHTILILENPKYNDLINRGFNMNKIKAYLHNHALLQLHKKVNEKITTFVIDQFAPKENYFRYLQDAPVVEHNIQFLTKAENLSPAVAASSIIARYTFVKKMASLSDEFGVNLPKGAGMQVNDVGRLLLRKLGTSRLRDVAKMNFKNLEKINDLAVIDDLNELSEL